MKDDLGDRIKDQYENRTRYYLPRRTYTIIRLDGKAFHTYTRNLKKPFDKDLSDDIDTAVRFILPEIQGSVFAYAQSDEISILLTDFATTQTCAWFDGNIQKMTSVAASMMTAQFNRNRLLRQFNNYVRDADSIDWNNQAFFDARVFTIPDRVEVMNYFIHRNQDCSRNSVSMVAQHHFSHKELHGKNTPEMHEMLHSKGVNWATDYSSSDKNGRLIVKEKIGVEGPKADGLIPITWRTEWVSNGAWKFTENKDKLLEMIPKYE